MKVKLYFPHIEHGTASVGYCMATIVDHVAEVDESEAVAIEHWIRNNSAVKVEGDALDRERNPFAEPDNDEEGEG